MARFSHKNPRNIEGGNFAKSLIARDVVPTLYELLGALPQDDADSLRAAFRKAAKASHPDNNPDDPDAPQKFRQIVRAHSILKDERQREAYDWLLTAAEPPQTPDTRRKGFARVGLPGPIGSMVIASVSIGAFVALERVLTTPAVSAQMQELSTRAIALTAAMPTPVYNMEASNKQVPGTPASNTVGRASERAPDRIAPDKEPEMPGTVEEITWPTMAVATGHDDDAPASPKPEVKDVRYYLERGDAAYRSGDFPLALTDFDLAIRLDPNSSDAYVNRAIVFRRMGDLKRAFADVSQARRIDEGKHQ